MVDQVKFSDISKQVGWDSRQISFPSKGSVLTLRNKVNSSKDIDSAAKILEYYRFCGSPSNDEERDVNDCIRDSVSLIRSVFT